MAPKHKSAGSSLDQSREAIIARWRERRGDAESETVIDIVTGADSVVVTSDRGADVCAILERCGDRATFHDHGSHVRINIPRLLVGSVAAWVKSAARSAQGKARAA